MVDHISNIYNYINTLCAYIITYIGLTFSDNEDNSVPVECMSFFITTKRVH